MISDLVAVVVLGPHPPDERSRPGYRSIWVRENNRAERHGQVPMKKLPGGNVEILDYVAAKELAEARPSEYGMFTPSQLALRIAAIRELHEETGLVPKEENVHGMGVNFKTHRGRCEHFFAAWIDDFGSLSQRGRDGEEIIPCDTEDLLLPHHDILPAHRSFLWAWYDSQHGRRLARHIDDVFSNLNLARKSHGHEMGGLQLV